MRLSQRSCFIAGLFLAVSASSTTSITVQTASGPLTGSVADGVSSFRGVPYAAPPVGARRWQDPVPPAPWTAPRPALADGAACPQLCALPVATCPPIQSEDCLFLNVFAPAGSPPDTEVELKPVLFWIHGGNFYQGYGGGILYDGSHFARDHDVLVVSINYRLGALGFLYTGDDNRTQASAPSNSVRTLAVSSHYLTIFCHQTNTNACTASICASLECSQFTGNFGLRDQRMAMRWVQDNIAAFGGDPARVTLFGQSAGGASVGAHLVMPASAGLFHAAVMESNPVGLPFRTKDKYPGFTKVVAKKAGCKTGLLAGSARTTTSTATAKPSIEECLRDKNASEVLAAQVLAQNDIVAELGQFLSLFQPFSPVVGIAELPAQTFQAFLNGAAHDVPVLLGSVRQEGVIFIYEAFTGAEPLLEETALLELIYGIKATPKIKKQYPMYALQLHAAALFVIQSVPLAFPASLTSQMTPSFFQPRGTQGG